MGMQSPKRAIFQFHIEEEGNKSNVEFKLSCSRGSENGLSHNWAVVIAEIAKVS